MNNTAQNNPQEYFVTDLEQSNQEDSLSDKMRPAKVQMQKTAVQIWPSINRFINTLLYYGLKIAKNIFKTALSMIKS